MRDHNIITLTDSYKVSHFKQYPKKTSKVYSYFESRGGAFDEVVFFGLQYYLKKYLCGQVVTAAKIDEAEDRFSRHFAHPLFNKAGWEHILNKHNGHLPISIKAQPEGLVVPNRNVMMTIENTDPECYWLTNYLETLLVQVWYGCTVATQSREMKKVILGYLNETGDPAGIDFKLHDFGFRGVSSVETAGVGGLAHLINFMGTDTFAGIDLGIDYYDAEMPGFSIPAAEHSTMTSWGRENEVDAYRNMLESYPEGLVAVVSDSYDIFHACRHIWGGLLKEEIMQRDGTLVIRPDSGDPPTIVCKILDILGEQFGAPENDKGYKVLDPHVRIIQGDGIDFAMLGKILSAMQDAGWSADNIAFGSGGGLLQKLNRDTLKFAFKCSSAIVDGEDVDVYKDPVTDKGKGSKRGRLALKYREGEYVTVEEDGDQDCLWEVFRDGELLQDQKFEDIRKRAAVDVS
jgi:nicotinamide phosphoribosyltransferase